MAEAFAIPFVPAVVSEKAGVFAGGALGGLLTYIGAAVSEDPVFRGDAEPEGKAIYSTDIACLASLGLGIASLWTDLYPDVGLGLAAFGTGTGVLFASRMITGKGCLMPEAAAKKLPTSKKELPSKGEASPVLTDAAGKGYVPVSVR